MKPQPKLRMKEVFCLLKEFAENNKEVEFFTIRQENTIDLACEAEDFMFVEKFSDDENTYELHRGSYADVFKFLEIHNLI